MKTTTENKTFWHNYETGETDFIDFPTEENVRFYLPYVQGASVGYFAYLSHRELGKSHSDAMLAVYDAFLEKIMEGDHEQLYLYL